MKESKEILGQIKVTIELNPSLERFTNTMSKDRKEFRCFLLQYLNDIVEDLMIPAKVSLVIKAGKDENEFTMNSYNIIINKNKCRLKLPTIVPLNLQAFDLARMVANSIYENREFILSAELSRKIMEKWIQKYHNSFLKRLKGTSRIMNPELESSKGFLEENFKKYLLEFIRNGFSINRAEKFLENQEDKNSGWRPLRKFEEAISGFDTIRVNLFLSKTQYQWMHNIDNREKSSEGNDDSIEKMLSMMRDGLYYELGIYVPKVRIEKDNILRKKDFRIQLNDLKLPPMTGLEQDQFLVNDTIDRLKLLNLTGEKAINPANGSECAIIKNQDRTNELCEEAGLTTWGAEGFITLALSAKIRNNASLFINLRTLNFSLDQLQKAIPNLVENVLKQFTIFELIRIFRELLDEELSIRDLRGILEELLVIRVTADVEGSDNGVSISDMVSLLRLSLKRYISNKYKRGENNIVFYLMDHQTESRINNFDELLDEDHDKLIRSIFEEVGNLSPSGKNPIILTTVAIRKKLRKLIEKEFPRLVVLCYEDFTPECNFQPIGRICCSNFKI
jgi:hypothetical protein